MDFLVVGFLIWSVPSALAARWLALEKGHGGTSWFVVGLFFGPLAVLTVGLAPRGYEGFKACVECDEPIRPAATRCPFCGTDLIAAEAEEQQAAS